MPQVDQSVAKEHIGKQQSNFLNWLQDKLEDEMKKDPSKVGTTACFEADMPLHRNYERGVGLQDRVEFRSAEKGMAVFSDIQFIGHPSQQYNNAGAVYDWTR